MLSGLFNSQTLAIKLAAWQFASQRAAYYEDMASLLETSHIRLLDIFVQDGQRFGEAPRGILARHWADRYLEMGADLAEAWADTMPEVDVAIIRVQANAGGDAIPGTLRDLARISKLTKNLRNQAISALAAGVVTFLLALMMVMYLIPFIINTMRESLGIPVQYWGSIGKTMAGIASFAENYRIAVFVGLGFLIFLGSRIANWTGRFRAWADQHLIGISTL
ncbi:MAG: hypothetical protein QM520_03765, partial [Gammaproteobacteria bacterium]|nr:hypothetical protein [Gammaproteobacteria bacterium]